MDQFREFVNKHPLVRDDVRNNIRTWQNIYDEWVLYGENDNQWEKYVNKVSNEETKTISKNGNNLSINMDSVKNIIGYVQKINPDSLNKTLNTVQKVIQIAQSVGGTKAQAVAAPFVASAYTDWWD